MHDALIDQASQLARLDPRKPRQANLRRAVSSAYYALFHYLVEESCIIVMGATRDRQAWRFALGRAFTHSTIKNACKSFAGGSLKKSVTRGLPVGPKGYYVVPLEIRNIADLLVELQEKRHLADYDRSTQFVRDDVLTLIATTGLQIRNFQNYSDCNDRRFFLACLWAWKDLAGRE